MEHPKNKLHLSSSRIPKAGTDVSQHKPSSSANAIDKSHGTTTRKLDSTHSNSEHPDSKSPGAENVESESSSAALLSALMISKIKNTLFGKETASSERTAHRITYSSDETGNSTNENQADLPSSLKSAELQELESLRKNTQVSYENQKALKVQNRGLCSENKDLKRCIDDLKGELGEFKQTMAFYKNELSGTSNLLAETRSKLEECEKAKSKVITALAISQKVDSLKLDDAFFRKSVSDLRFQVKNWAVCQRLSPKDPSPLWENRCNFLSEIAPLYKEFFTSSDEIAQLLQAFVWNLLVMFLEKNYWIGCNRHDSTGDDATSQLTVGFTKLKKQLCIGKLPGEFSEEYNEWRCFTARLIADALELQNIEDFARELTQHIIDMWRPISNPEFSMDFKGLNDISKHALTLARQLATQRAFFEFEWSRPSRSGNMVNFDPELMSTVEDLEDKDHGDDISLIALFSLAPGLRRYGTSDGTRLSESNLLIKNEVKSCLHKARRPI